MREGFPSLKAARLLAILAAPHRGRSRCPHSPPSTLPASALRRKLSIGAKSLSERLPEWLRLGRLSARTGAHPSPRSACDCKTWSRSSSPVWVCPITGVWVCEGKTAVPVLRLRRLGRGMRTAASADRGAYAAGTWTSVVPTANGCGIGSPAARRAARCTEIVSRMSRSTSSRVSPTTPTPGRSGQKAPRSRLRARLRPDSPPSTRPP